MGDKITIDSATLVNKGFEVIEAHWLFGVPAERISVLIHPQSIVHSMVEFGDGAIKAQLGSPDMRTPIAYALSFPQRLDRPVAPFSFAEHPTLTFAEVDRIKYPALDLAYDCLRRGGTAGCTMNGANEVAVAAFLARRCGASNTHWANPRSQPCRPSGTWAKRTPKPGVWPPNTCGSDYRQRTFLQ